MPSGTHHFGDSGQITELLQNTTCSHQNLRAKIASNDELNLNTKVIDTVTDFRLPHSRKSVVCAILVPVV